jgi:Leu/Phe-tRNA-protein transferase
MNKLKNKFNLTQLIIRYYWEAQDALFLKIKKFNMDKSLNKILKKKEYGVSLQNKFNNKSNNYVNKMIKIKHLKSRNTNKIIQI